MLTILCFNGHMRSFVSWMNNMTLQQNKQKVVVVNEEGGFIGNIKEGSHRFLNALNNCNN